MTMTISKLKNILIIEDNEASRDLMREAFRLADYEGELQMVENGDAAFRLLRRQSETENPEFPDLIILDLNLPGKSGPEIMRELKKDEKMKDIPVVVLTGSNSARDIQACSRWGCKYLLKPSRFHELVNLVKSLADFC